MRTSTAEQLAFFASRAPGLRADLFTLTLQGGTVHRWTSLDIAVSGPTGQTWLAQSPNLALVSMTVRNTTEVPTLELKLSALDSDFAGGTNIKLAIHQGEFDGARLLYSMLPMANANDTTLGPPITLFEGRIGEIAVTATGATLKVRGDVVVMSQYAPRNVYETSCQHRFCDEGCTLLAANFTYIGCDVGAGSNIHGLFWGGVKPPTPSLAAFGAVTFLTGPNAGHKRQITSADGTSLNFAYPLWFAPQVGNLFNVFLGCDKLLATCTTTYDNRLHFRGFPAIPDASYAA